MDNISIEATNRLLPIPYTQLNPFALEHTPIATPNKPFIEANTKDVTLAHLQHDCIVPVFSKDNEITISHNAFIETVHSCVSDVFKGQEISTPEVRVSHIIKGRSPDAIHKSVNELTEYDKTTYYERMAFMIETPSISEVIDGCRLNLSVGGVRAYNHENLFTRKNPEKFRVFIGFKNLVCCNLCISTDGFCEEIRAYNTEEIYTKVFSMISSYNAQEHLAEMMKLSRYSLTEHQFAQLIGKSRLYQFLPSVVKKCLPSLEFTDSHLSLIARNYYKDPDFAHDRGSKEINLWNLYNLFTGANKTSYIDTFLPRSVNATEFLHGIASALEGNSRYQWWLE